MGVQGGQRNPAGGVAVGGAADWLHWKEPLWAEYWKNELEFSKPKDRPVSWNSPRLLLFPRDCLLPQLHNFQISLLWSRHHCSSYRKVKVGIWSSDSACWRWLVRASDRLFEWESTKLIKYRTVTDKNPTTAWLKNRGEANWVGNDWCKFEETLLISCPYNWRDSIKADEMSFVYVASKMGMIVL